LHAAGYFCGGFGKWGLGFIGTEGDPLAQGFDHFFGYNCQRWAHRYYPAYLWDDRRQFFLPGNDMRHQTTYAPEVIQQRAEAFIRDSKDKPFFVYLAATLPHAELLAPDDAVLARFKGKFPEKPFAGWAGPWGGTAEYGPDAAPGGYCPQPMPRATYAAMVTHLDQQVGQILRLVDELGLAENTLILFSSDNGPHSEGGNDPYFFDSGGPLRGIKRDLYEGGIRVPMLVRWPGHIAAGSISSLPAAFWDVLPTLAEVAGAGAPEGTDGISFAPTLLRKGEQARHDYLYWEFGEVNPGQAMRSGDWKAIHFFAQPGKPEYTELYHLATDLGETNNVAAAHPDVVAAMQGRMREAHRTNPRFLLPMDAESVPPAVNRDKARVQVIDD
jgi:arylsulfatase A-like enzyme